MDELQKLFTQARTGTLPPDFDRWDISDKYGGSVAHTAAWHHKLPEDFDRFELWELADDDGITVRDVYNGNDGTGRTLKWSGLKFS